METHGYTSFLSDVDLCQGALSRFRTMNPNAQPEGMRRSPLNGEPFPSTRESFLNHTHGYIYKYTRGYNCVKGKAEFRAKRTAQKETRARAKDTRQ
jgi:hypothetical protein